MNQKGKYSMSAKKKNIRFRISAKPKSDVQIAGTFNDWIPQKLKNVGKGVYSATLSLPVGEYQYKFIVDGEWTVDENNSDWVPNEFGGLNSVIHV